MKTIWWTFLLVSVLASCVSAKKFKALEEKQRICSEELEKYRQSSANFETKSKQLQTSVDSLRANVAALRTDTAKLGSSMRSLTRELVSATKELDDL